MQEDDGKTKGTNKKEKKDGKTVHLRMIFLVYQRRIQNRSAVTLGNIS
jgi:hypothetical protein